MAPKERVREAPAGSPGEDYFRKRTELGWRLVAVEWERDIAVPQPSPRHVDTPFGTQVAADCRQLEEHAREQRALRVMLDGVSRDRPLEEIAAELNRNGLETRQGARWNVATVFRMLPRLIDTGPAILASPEWQSSRVTRVDP